MTRKEKNKKKPPTDLPTSLRKPNTQLSTPITYVFNNTFFFQEMENASGYELDSGVCSNLDVELNVLN